MLFLFRIQRTAFRCINMILQIITRAHYNPSSDCLHKLSGVLPVKLIMTRESLKTVRNLVSWSNQDNHFTSEKCSCQGISFFWQTAGNLSRDLPNLKTAPTALSQKKHKITYLKRVGETMESKPAKWPMPTGSAFVNIPITTTTWTTDTGQTV